MSTLSRTTLAVTVICTGPRHVTVSHVYYLIFPSPLSSPGTGSSRRLSIDPFLSATSIGCRPHAARNQPRSQDGPPDQLCALLPGDQVRQHLGCVALQPLPFWTLLPDFRVPILQAPYLPTLHSECIRDNERAPIFFFWLDSRGLGEEVLGCAAVHTRWLSCSFCRRGGGFVWVRSSRRKNSTSFLGKPPFDRPATHTPILPGHCRCKCPWLFARS